MKNLLIGLFVLGSFSLYAEEIKSFSIINQTHPEMSLKFECEENQCSTIKLKLLKNNEITKEAIIFKDDLESIANERLKRSCKFRQQTSYYLPYHLSKEVTYYSGIQEDWNEGYEVKAVGKSIVKGLAAIVDTIALPISGISYLAVCTRDGVEHKKVAKKSLRLLGDGSIREMKNSRFSKLLELFNL